MLFNKKKLNTKKHICRLLLKANKPVFYDVIADSLAVSDLKLLTNNLSDLIKYGWVEEVSSDYYRISQKHISAVENFIADM